MADIAQKAELNPDDDLLRGLSKLSNYLWQEAWSHGADTVSGDADALHDMRVSIRRLRTLLKNFEAKGEASLIAPHLRDEMKRFRRRQGKLGDALGAVRDLDVLDEYLRDYAKQRLKRPIEECPGLAMFERYIQTTRAAAFGPMVKRVNRSREPAALREQFARFALGLPGATPPTLTLRGAALKVLRRQLDEMNAHEGVLADPHDAAGHHELRKSLRRIRYTIETFGPCYEIEADPILEVLVKLQDQLGEMNDRDVLRTEIKKACGTDDTAALEEDLAQFIRYGEGRNRRLLGQVRKEWAARRAEGFFNLLPGETATPPAESAAPSEAEQE